MGILSGITELDNPTPITVRWLRKNNWIVNYRDVDDTWRKTKVVMCNYNNETFPVVFEVMYCTTTNILVIRLFNTLNECVRKYFDVVKVYSQKDFNSLTYLEILLEDETLINIFKKNENNE